MDDATLLRHSAHIFLPGMGISGVERLQRAHVLVVGLGGLGSVVALYLVSSGIGTLTLADPDTVSLSNLPRQILYEDRHVGMLKTQAAHETLTAMGTSQLHLVSQRLAGDALQQAVASADLVCDCSDNFTTRFAVNAACVTQKRQLVSAAVIGLSGQLLVIDPQEPEAGCYRCLYPETEEQAESCSERGVLGPIVGTLGSLQASEAIKVLTGLGAPLTRELWLLDAQTMDSHKIRRRRDPYCPLCRA
jgi:adenylyltransferase/sulfurtransferase